MKNNLRRKVDTFVTGLAMVADGTVRVLTLGFVAPQFAYEQALRVVRRSHAVAEVTE